ncbi:MAG: class I SAM-dependent methyltransferase [Euryarchaeota archaeon]|nr:class I SAM-dependent methyltransferase [Euryarchaeota archaeon]
MDFQAHWQAIHEENGPTDVSWYQAAPTLSLKFVQETKVGPEARILDVGCGQAGLAGPLVERGFRKVTALDISDEAIRRAKERLGGRAEAVVWIRSDVLDFSAPEPFDLWHDRAVLHFFTDPEDQRRYVASMTRNLVPGGHAIIAGFAPDGPEKCSRLPVVRRDPDNFARLLGPGFALIGSEHEIHTTPWGKQQAFQWAVFKRH